MEKKEFLEDLDYYIEYLLFDREDIFEPAMIDRFHCFRERIDLGLKEFKISKRKQALLRAADIMYIKDIDEILVWWYGEGVYSIREKYKEKISYDMWYWWLDEIASGKYPTEKLPEYLWVELLIYYKHYKDDKIIYEKKLKEYREIWSERERAEREPWMCPIE